MKYLVAGNYTRFAVTLTQKSGELIVPYIPTEGDVVQISLYGARRFDYPNYEQAQNVLTFEDNGCLNVGLYCLEVKITEANSHKLRCMYREQIRVVASNDDVPTDASFSDDDVQLSGQFDIVASTEIVVDDELSLTSTNPVQNKVVTAAINDKADEIDVYEDLEDGVYVYRVDLLSHFGEDTTTISSAILPYATQDVGGLMSAADKTKLDGIEDGANKTLFEDAPTQGSTKAVTSGGLFTYYRGAFFDFNYTPSADNWEVSFMNKDEQEIFSTTFDCADTEEGIAGLMSLADKTKLEGIETGANKTIYDNAPTQSSTNAVTSGGVYSSLAGKQDTLTFDNVPTQNSDNPVKSGGVYTALRDKLDKIDDGVYVSTQSGGRIDFYASGTQYILVIASIPNATTTENGLMSAADYTKLAGIATGATRVIVDSTFDTTSNNAISNSAVATALGDIETILDNILGN